MKLYILSTAGFFFFFYNNNNPGQLTGVVLHNFHYLIQNYEPLRKWGWYLFIWKIEKDTEKPIHTTQDNPEKKKRK